MFKRNSTAIGTIQVIVAVVEEHDYLSTDLQVEKNGGGGREIKRPVTIFYFASYGLNSIRHTVTAPNNISCYTQPIQEEIMISCQGT